MQAFISRNGKLIVNTQIQPNEKEELLDFISKAMEKGVSPKELYNVEGNISGIAFIINEEIIEDVENDNSSEDEEEEVTD